MKLPPLAKASSGLKEGKQSHQEYSVKTTSLLKTSESAKHFGVAGGLNESRLL